MHKLQIPYEQLLETIQEGIWVIDADSNTTFVNPKMAEILGYAVEEMIGKNLFECMDEKEIQNTERKVEDRKSGLSETHESRLKHKDGHDVYVELKTVPITDDEGNYKGAIAGVADITERKEMEDQVKIYQDIANNMQVGLHVYHLENPDDDSTLRMVATNPAAAVHTGLTEEEVMEKTLDESFPNLRGTNHPQRYAEVARSGKSLEFEDTYYSDDKIVNAAFAVKVFPLPKNCVGVIFENITKRKQAEEALRKTELFLRSTIDGLSANIVVINNQGEIILTNKAYRDFAESNGIELNAVSEGVNYLAICDVASGENSEEATPFAEGVRKVISGEYKSFSMEYPCHSPDEERWFFAYVTPSIGEITQMVVIAHENITDRKKAEEALRRSEQELRTIADNMTDVVAMADVEGRFVYISESSRAVFGYKHEELIGKSIIELVHEDDVLRVGTTFQEGIAEGKKSASIEHRIRNKNGSYIWVEAIGSFIIDDNGQPSGVLFVSRDISDRKQAEESLKESEEKFRFLVNYSYDLIWILTADGFLTYVSPSWENMLGYKPSYIVEKAFHTFVHPEDVVPCEKYIVEVLEAKKAFPGPQYRVRHADASWRWHEATMTPVYSDEGHFKYFVGVSRDITDRKKIEEALKLQVRERAAVDTFTYSVSNDLQAPLRRIEGFSEMLLEECSDQLNERARDYLNRISTQVSSMKALTDALLHLSKVVTHEIDRETVDLSALARAHLEKLQLSEPTRRVEKIVAPNIVIEGDADLTSLILVNLLDNAWKFTSRVEEALIEFGSTEQNGRTVYYLKDNGAGFDMNHAAKLFTPFNKLHSVEDYPGIGFGLNLVYRIISRHGGEIWAEGEVGKGACFYFTL